MIQYNLARLRSMPANQKYLDGFDRMRCEFMGEDGERCGLWKVEPGDFCHKHAQPPEGMRGRPARTKLEIR